MSENSSCGVVTTAKRGHHFVAITKKGRQFLKRKIGVTPSVAAPGDTNPSDQLNSPTAVVEK